MAPKASTGYYRYTDINFEWHTMIDEPAERSALKAFLAPDCLTSPDNPLRDPSKDGIGFFIGMLPNGESRLLFSSKQIEYIRYWLHAMGLTKNLLPLPNSHYLMPLSAFESVSPEIYTSSGQLKNAQKDIQKNNKKVKGADTGLTAGRKQFERVRDCYLAAKGTWIALDFEGWERDHEVITEFGYTKLTWVDGKPVIEDGHWVPQEHTGYRNGQYVVDNRNHFLFGETRVISLKQFMADVRKMISDAAAQGPLFLVFHDFNNDLKDLTRIEAPIETLARVLPDTVPESGMYAVDTGLLYSALAGETRRTGLERMTKLLGFSKFDYFHNAGNDAHYTMEALQSMAAGAQIDKQREQRWSGKTTGVKLNIPESESEDSDDDMRDWYGPNAIPNEEDGRA
ncbi:hypothetical protein AURDEDRAFT_141640 [Auricularia subglabra TFB-10046 SS5]|nr:hypothetical protein AURDEDRAFT_141640 [Auricularia subglabra TFB-10046 SS5]